MPMEMERKMKAQMMGKPWSKKRKDQYLYGAMVNRGWKPNKKERGTGKHRGADKHRGMTKNRG